MMSTLARRTAFVGALLLLVHMAATIVGTALRIVEGDSPWWRLVSASCYLAAYLAFAAAFWDKGRILSIIFSVLMILGVGVDVISVIIQRIETGQQGSAHLNVHWDYLIPTAFLVFSLLLFKGKVFLKIIGAFYLLGSAAWLGTVVLEDVGQLATYLRFFTELVGMNGTIALIIWGIFQFLNAERPAKSAEQAAAV